MPLFEYRCKKCGHVFEHLAAHASDHPKRCPKCGAPKPEKQLSTFAARVNEGGSACSTGTCSTGGCPTGTCPFS